MEGNSFFCASKRENVRVCLTQDRKNIIDNTALKDASLQTNFPGNNLFALCYNKKM